MAERLTRSNQTEAGHKGVFRFVAFVIVSWLLGILFFSLFLAVPFALVGELQEFGIIIAFVLFFGAWVTLPIPLVGALAGYPLWLWMVSRLIKGGFSRDVAIALSAGSVVTLTLAILFLFSAVGGGNWASVTSLFQVLLILLACGLPAAVITSIVAFSNTPRDHNLAAARERSAIYAEICRLETQSKAKKDSRDSREDSE